MSNTRIKICGFTQADQARQAAQMGVDALGLVFYEPSPRSVDWVQASEIAKAVAPFCSLVGLFVNPTEQYVRDTLASVPLDILQFHGDETEEFCNSFQRRYLKAIRMRPELMPEDSIAAYPSAAGVLLDAYRPGVPGGTGESFDWKRVPKQSSIPLILAGGLDSANVASAARSTGVYGVDVSGGVEAAAGDKCLKKIESFINAVRSS